MGNDEPVEEQPSNSCPSLAAPFGFLVGGAVIFVAVLALAGSLPYVDQPIRNFLRIHKTSTLNKCILDSPRCWSQVFGAS